MATKPHPRSVTEADKIVGQHIRQLRMQLGMSQDALAKTVGLTFQQIQKYEKGVNRVSAARLLEFCEALDTTPEGLLGWKMRNRVKPMNEYSHTIFEIGREFSALPEDLQIMVRRICGIFVELLPKKKR